jgi:hypothetical protein
MVHVRERPTVSIVVEGKNERNRTATIPVVDGLRTQTYPLDRVEVIFAGDARSAGQFREAAADLRLGSLECLEIEDGTYHGLKHAGAQRATADILVFLDWDVVVDPQWLSLAVDAIHGGDDAAGGVTLFRGWGRLGPFHPLLLAASSTSWERPFLEANNVAFRTDVYRRYPYRIEDGRRAWIAQHDALLRDGARLRRNPRQLAYHYFSLRWWLFDFNVRAGGDAMVHRRSLVNARQSSWPWRILRTGPLAPAVALTAGILRDVPRWFRYTGALGVPLARRVTCVPIAILVSAAAYACQAAGMLGVQLAPEAMRRFSDAR